MHDMKTTRALAAELPHAADVVDRSAIRTGQAITACMLGLAFVLSSVPLAVGVGVANLLATVHPRLSVLGWVHRNVALPLGIRSEPIDEPMAPHRFAQRLSGTVTVAGGISAALGAFTFGWALVLLVVGLATVSVALRWCAGCVTYRIIDRARA